MAKVLFYPGFYPKIYSKGEEIERPKHSYLIDSALIDEQIIEHIKNSTIPSSIVRCEFDRTIFLPTQETDSIVCPSCKTTYTSRKDWKHGNKKLVFLFFNRTIPSSNEEFDALVHKYLPHYANLNVEQVAGLIISDWAWGRVQNTPNIHPEQPVFQIAASALDNSHSTVFGWLMSEAAKGTLSKALINTIEKAREAWIVKKEVDDFLKKNQSPKKSGKRKSKK